LNHQIQNCADDDAPCQPVNPHRRSEEDRAEDDAQLVHGGRQRGDEENLMRVEHADDQASQTEQDGGDQLNAEQ
jgi:hypothetical protein